MARITDVEALGLIRRFSALDKFPRIAEGQAALAEALQESTVNMEHAREVCREFAAECPKPADIRNVAFNCIGRYRAEQPVCPMCQGSTWIHTERIIRGQKLEASARCSCFESAPKPPDPQPQKKGLTPIRAVKPARAEEGLF